jgi:hypothetical protein
MLLLTRNGQEPGHRPKRAVRLEVHVPICHESHIAKQYQETPLVGPVLHGNLFL